MFVGAKLGPPSADDQRALPFSTLPKIVLQLVPCNIVFFDPNPDENTANMKLNVKNIRYLTSDDWRVLTAVCARVPCFSA